MPYAINFLPAGAQATSSDFVQQRQSMPLHVDQPGWGTLFIHHPQHLIESLGHEPQTKVGRFGSLVLISFTTQVAKLRHNLGFYLILKYPCTNTSSRIFS